MKRKVYLITPTYTLADHSDAYMTPPDIWSGGIKGLVERVAPRMDSEGVVLLDQAAARNLGWADDGETWQTHVLGEGRSRQVIYVARLDGIERDGCTLVNPRWHQDTAGAFYLLHSLLGTAYHRSPGATGLALLGNLYPRRDSRHRRVVWESDGPEDAGELAYSPADWSRKPTARFVHGYDKRRAGLAAMTVVEVARRSLKHTGKREFDPKMAGWWLISVPAWNDPRMPDPAGYGEPIRPGSRLRWVTTPTVRLLCELAEQGYSDGVTDRDIYDSWTAPASRLFVHWAAQVERAYQRATEIIHSGGSGLWVGADQDAVRVRDAIKDVYRQTAGMFNSANSWARRPDWYAAIVAQHRCNLWRKAWEIGHRLGRWPVLIDGDKIWYESDMEDAVAAAPSWQDGERRRGIVIDDRLGGWRHDGTREVAR